MSHRPALRTVAVALAWALIGARGLAAQSGWVVRSAPAVELWYHGMALVGAQGFGALPLYDRVYPAAVRADRDRRNLPPTLLERGAAGFRSGFESDSVFELMHFLPLSAASVSPDQLLSTNAPAVANGMLKAGADRQLFERFLEALRSEYREAWRSDRIARDSALEAARASIERRWGAIAEAVGPFLARYQLTSGIMLPVPGLGPDGRFVAGERGAPALVAVQLPRDPSHAEDAAFFALRELCYPAVRLVLDASRDIPADRTAAELLSGRAAVRCGSLALGAASPELAAAYEAAFLRAAGSSVGFAAAFPVPDDLMAALARAVAANR